MIACRLTISTAPKFEIGRAETSIRTGGYMWVTAGRRAERANNSKGLTLIDRDSIPVRSRLILGARALALVLLATSPSLADGPRGAGWISGDAVAYVEVARPSAILERLTGEPVRGLLESSPNFQKYLADDGYRRGRAAVDAITGALGTTWDRALLDLVGGGLILVVEPSMPPRVYLIATPRDPAFLPRAQEKVLELARADAASKGQPDPIKSAEHRGIKGYALGPKAAHAIVDG